MPTMHSTAFEQHAQYLYQEMDINFPKKMEESYSEVMDHYRKIGREQDDNGVMDIDVTFEMTWLTRAYRTHIGVSFVLEADTRHILDFEVLSNTCHLCSTRKSTDPDIFQVTRQSLPLVFVTEKYFFLHYVDRCR